MKARRTKGTKTKSKKANKFASKLQLTRSLYGSPVEKIIQFTENITTSNANAAAWFSSTSAISYPLLTYLFNSADFTEMNDAYMRCHLQRLRLEVTRVFTETSNTTIISTGIPQLRIGFFPSLSGASISSTVVNNLESAHIIDPHEVKPIVIEFPIPSVQAFDSNGRFYNPGVPFDTGSYLSNVVGCILGLGWNNTTGASSTTVIYNVRIQVLARFDMPF